MSERPKAGCIYLDYQATTPCDERVVVALSPFFSTKFGNPSSTTHEIGREAGNAVSFSRLHVAQLIDAHSAEILFTGSATESINMAVQGIARGVRRKPRLHTRRRLVTTAIEHKAVLETARSLEREGWIATVLPVEPTGRLDPDVLENALDEDVLFVSVQAANQEIGTLQDIKQLAAVAHRYGAVFHCDASQAVGKIPVNVVDWDVDLLSFSGHKLYGPKGVGVLYVRNGAQGSALEPIIYGGGQEYGLRSGTQNVPAIVGLGEACRLASELLEDERARLNLYRDRFEKILTGDLDVQVNGDTSNRLPGATSLTFRGIDAETLIFQVPTLMLSTGSACTSGAPEPSHVLTAIGLSRDDAEATIRVSFGRPSKSGDAADAARALAAGYRRL